MSLQWREPLWLLLALYPLALLLWHRLRQRRQTQAYADPALLPWLQCGAPSRRALQRPALQIFVWLLFALALAGPRTPLPDEAAPAAEMDILVVLDLSRSMQVADVLPDRLQRAVLELHEWLGMQSRNRIGVVVYAARPHLYVPLTADVEALEFYLAQVDRLQLPTQGSDAAAALDFSREILTASAAENVPAALLWLTDGDIEDAQRAPLQAAVQRLQQAGLPLYILGLGSEEGDAVPLGEGQWLQHNGMVLRSRLNVTLLQGLATAAQGRFSQVRDDASDWQELYQRGMRRAAAADLQTPQSQWQEHYPWPLSAAVLLLMWLLAAAKRVNSSALNGVAATVLLLSVSALWPLPATATPVLSAGIEAYRAADYAAAIRHFTDEVFAASSDAGRARALYNLGNSYFQQGDFEAAQQTFADVLRYRPGHAAAIQNLALAETVLAEIRRQRALRQGRENHGERGAYERRVNSLDWDVAVPLSFEMDEGSVAQPASAELPPLPLNPQQLSQWVNSGLLRLQQREAEAPQGWYRRQQSLHQARIELQGMELDSVALWQRLFEVEEGFVAPQKQPHEIPGVAPW